MGFRGYGDLPDSYFIFISGKQPIVTKSSMEAELVAANTVVDYLVWARAMCLEMHSDLLPSILYQDIKSTITAILKGAGTFKRSKHINVRYFYLRQLIEEGVLDVKWVASADMIADILTKPLTGEQFVKALGRLIGLSQERIEFYLSMMK